jgi:glycosyltransferase involved in cell wall biosynthesis
MLPLDYLDAQRKLLSLIDIAFPMATSEERWLREGLGFAGSAHVVPNGFTFGSASSAGPVTAKHSAIAVGRIEPRKNSLELAGAAVSAGVSVTFAGALNSNHPDYSGEFLRLCEDPRTPVTYLGSLTHNDLRSALLEASVYINPAWFEVVSQSDLEAAALGLKIVTTEHSYISDWLVDPPRIDPAALCQPDAAAALLQALARARVTPLPPNPPTWKDAGAKLAEGYRAALEGTP